MLMNVYTMTRRLLLGGFPSQTTCHWKRTLSKPSNNHVEQIYPPKTSIHSKPRLENRHWHSQAYCCQYALASSWTQLFNTTAPNVQRQATAPTPTKVVTQKSVTPALLTLDISTVPAGAQLFLNDEVTRNDTNNCRPPTREWRYTNVGKERIQRSHYTLTIEDSSLNIALTPTPEVKKTQPNKVSPPRKDKENNQAQIESGVKDVSDPFE